LRTAIQEQKAKMMTGGPAPAQTPAPAATPAAAAAPPATPAGDTASSLAALDSVRSQGLITEEEYQAKRSEILGRL